jgi:formylglycine-generating enzyme required for sulfatase activity
VIELVLIPPGEFMMGSENGNADEKPVHRVTIGTGFYLGKYEVTQAQWQAVMGNRPSYFKGDNLPVERVSWNDGHEFVQRLNQRNDGYVYRLPTEAEWEYACRAGTTGDYAGPLDSLAWYGNNPGQHYLDVAPIWNTDPDDYGKQLTDNRNQTHPVGTKQANAFGLYDMHGNVWEWCQDFYDDNYYRHSPSTDPQGPSSGYTRVLRGGSWFYAANFLCSAYRIAYGPGVRNINVGFRVAAVARTHR